jgi:hyaluronate lyase
MRQHDDSDTDQTEHRVSDMSRRGFLQSGSTAVGGSLLGAGLADQASDTASATTSSSAPAAEFAKVRQNWRDIQLGYDPDRSDPYIDRKVTTMENTTSNLLESYNTTDSNKVFDDFDLDGGQLRIKQTYDRLRWMAWAYKTEPSSYYGDTSLRDKIIDGMKLIYNEGYFTENSDTAAFYEKVANPRRVINLTILLYDDLSPEWRSKFAATVDYHNSFLAIAASRKDVDAIVNSMTQIGLATIREDAELLAKAVEFPRTAVYATDPPGSGHYPDGTKLAHQNHPYNTGMYGGLGQESTFLEVVDGTQWEDDISWRDNVYEIAVKAYIGTMYDGAVMNGFMGRALSRHKFTVYKKGLRLLHANLRVAESAPDDVARRIKEMVKYHVQAPDSFDLRDRGVPGNPLGISDVELMSDLMNDDSISARPEQFTPKVFDNADRQVIKTDDFAAEISGYSSRIANYEGNHGGHRKGWHTGRGMTLLHTSDEQQFVEDMWASIDWYRLPGTTVVNKPLGESAYERQTSSEDWVGGSNLDNVGAFGMSMGPDYTDMSGTKSWLTVGGDQIVCLGTDISNTDEDGPTETTLINRKLNSNGDNSFVVDGSSQSTSLGWSDTLSDPSWAWLEDTGGYYFPGSSEYQAKREEHSGAWDEVNDTLGGGTIHTHTFLTLWQDHGTAPSDASYQYVLLPERTQSEIEAYANNPPLDIEKHASNVQAVRNPDHYAANFWEPASAGEVTTHHPASVVLEIDRENSDSQSDDYPDTLSIAVADPTQQQDSLRVEIDRNVDAASVDHPRVTVVNDINPFVFDVDLSGVHGADPLSRSTNPPT